jgi:mono/diheme cytochrome c family protein
MKRSTTATLVLGAALLLASQFAQSQAKVDPGKLEYEAHCAVCHGVTGKGDGPYGLYLTRRPSDLTVLAKNNGGALPVLQVYELIDGTREVGAHGTRTMPVWGRAYRLEAGEYYFGAPYDPEPYVRMRILALVDYINRIQAK